MSAAAAAMPIDWARARELALGVLGWTPDAFWRATPDDLRAALAGLRAQTRAAPVPALRPDLERLRAQFEEA